MTMIRRILCLVLVEEYVLVCPPIFDRHLTTIDVPFIPSGRYTADASLWSVIVTMLATLDFCPAKDAQGKELGVQPKWLNGLTQ